MHRNWGRGEDEEIEKESKMQMKRIHNEKVYQKTHRKYYRYHDGI